MNYSTTPLKLLNCHSFSDPGAAFFSKYDGKNFGPIQNRKGSILEEFGKVTNVDWMTATSLRRQLEPVIQGNDVMKTRSKSIAQHTAATGSRHYDRTEPEFRAAAMHHIGTQDGSDISKRKDDISEEVASKRARIEKEDDAAKISAALANIQKSKLRNVQLGKTCNVLPQDRGFLQSVFSKGGEYHKYLDHDNKFPSKFNCLCFLQY